MIEIYTDGACSGNPGPGGWRWVKGHAGHPDNERVDALARAGLEQVRRAGKAVSVENKEAASLF